MRYLFALLLLLSFGEAYAADTKLEAWNEDGNAPNVIYSDTFLNDGWYYTPPFKYRLSSIKIKGLAFASNNWVDRPVTVTLYSERPSLGGKTLATGTVASQSIRGSFAGPTFNPPVIVDSNHRYFIGIRNIGLMGVIWADYPPGYSASVPPAPGYTNVLNWYSDVPSSTEDMMFAKEFLPGAGEVSPLPAQPMVEFYGTVYPPEFLCKPNPFVPLVRGVNLPYKNTVETAGNPLDASLIENNSKLLAQGAFWRFAPPVTGNYYVDVSGPLDTAFTISTGDCCNQALVYSQYTNTTRGSEHGVVALSAGTTYTLVGRGLLSSPVGSDFGQVTMMLDGPITTTTNNTCAGATTIAATALPYTKTFNTQFNKSYFDTALVGTEGGGGGPDAWFKFRPNKPGTYDVQAYGHGTDLVLGVYTGACGSLTKVDETDWTPGGERTKVTLTSGTTYMLLVEGFSDPDRGEISLTVKGPGVSASSTNSTCASATVIAPGALPYMNTVDTTYNPNGRDNSVILQETGAGGSPDAWWKFTPTVSGRYIIGVQQAEDVDYTDAILDLSLAVYTGSCGALTEIHAVDNTSSPNEITSVTLTAGVPYLIQAEGFGVHDYGKIMLLVDGPCVPRTNNTCAGATNLALPVGTTNFYVNTLGNINTRKNSATANRYRNTLFSPSADAYLRLTPQVTGLYSLALNTAFTPSGVPFDRFGGDSSQDAGEFIDVALEVEQDNCGTITPLAAIDSSYVSYAPQNGERLLLRLTAGVPVLVFIDGATSADEGPMQLTTRGPLIPSGNATCAAVNKAEPEWELYP